MTRRQFLVGTCAVASGLLVSPQVIAARRRVGKHVFALLSDTHIAEDKSFSVRGTNMAENLRRAVSDILAMPEIPAQVFHTGDCAYNTGKAGDYASFSDLLAPLRSEGIPLHVGLGNHDNRDNFWRAPAFKSESQAKRLVPEKQVAFVETPRANWLLLDSLETTNVTPGLLGKQQLDWLAKTLDANPKKPALILLHHNPGISGNMGLKDTVAFFEIIRPRRQVKAYIFGHTHTWELAQDQSGIYLVNLPAVGYVFSAEEPSGWVKAELLRDGVDLELRCIDPAHKKHLQTAKLKWRSSED